MKIYVVNLKKASQKRLHMEAQLKKVGINDYEFIEAVYGADLSPEFISEYVYDYPACSLTLGEVGCSLSHIKIYKAMVEKKVPYALVLEDDIDLPNDILALLTDIKTSIDVPQSKVITLGRANKISLLKKHFSFKQYTEYTAVTAFGTYAYVINLAAARSLSQNLLPIKYEADMFIHFRENGWLQQYHVLFPAYIEPLQDGESSLEAERVILKKARHQYKKYKLNKSRPFFLKIKNRLQRIFWRIGQVRPKNKTSQ